MLNPRGRIDHRHVFGGKDGVLLNSSGIILASVETFSSKVNFTNGEFKPLGSMQAYDIALSFKVSLTLQQAVIEDDAFIQEVLEWMSDGYLPLWNFQGMVRGRNGSEQRINYRSCIPTGDLDLQNLNVGEKIMRNWSLTVNEPPDLQALLTYTDPT
ncbi:MAG: hypothetical protein IJT94_11760 [Oscillibacter sp.]|nr:hypothetical protein [Oscillibacter sp.]